MKNATKHAEQLRSLFKRLMKEQKPEPMQKMQPLPALVRGAMSFDVSDERADEAMRHIEREFVDLNELRVATDLEIQELLGVKYPDIERRVAMITQCLNFIFEREHTLSLDRLTTISKRDARHFLREMPDVHPFVEAFVMLFAFDGSAIPVDEGITTYLKEQGVVEEEATVDETQRFLEHQVKADESYDFYKVVRRAAHQRGGGGGSSPSPKKKARARA
jgi:endonuclease III